MHSEPVTYVIAYLVGVLIAAVTLGATMGEEVEDNLWVAWAGAALWPMIVVAAIFAAFITGPFWLGRKLRELF